MPDTFTVRCQRVRRNNGHFTMFFDHDESLPSVLVNLPKSSALYEEGRIYRITIEPAPEAENGMGHEMV